ncbi:MAG: 4'-phosphopantetheinyl transferase superfamily protein [Mycoplasma sp.]|nr:4'-phosphopantetheinyl transferase superfamily protein [Mycoplasma sp.]
MEEKRNSFDLDVGIDLTYVSLFKNNFSNLAQKILTENEMKECLLKNKSYQAQYLASRWAAKEAIWKSLKNKKDISLLKIEILNNSNGKPYCTNFDNAKISISYCKDLVIAICIFV